MSPQFDEFFDAVITCYDNGGNGFSEDCAHLWAKDPQAII
jgi:hypothetical protein